MKIKTIDIIAKEWNDNKNGNSYFAGFATINMGMKSERVIKVPFQYGHDNRFIESSMHELEKKGVLTDVVHHFNGSTEPLWRYCDERSIALRTHITRNCTKKEVMDFVR